jgi:hypothetical protein
VPTKNKPMTSPMNPGDRVPPGTAGAGENSRPKCGGRSPLSGRRCEPCGATGKIIEGVGGA